MFKDIPGNWFEVLSMVHPQTNKQRHYYKCIKNNCGKIFPKKQNIRNHFRTHTGDRPYKCKLCHKKFTQIGNLKMHEMSIHNYEGLLQNRKISK